jgi:iron-sulfur cluster repair protein YtfE (RIC family)
MCPPEPGGCERILDPIQHLLDEHVDMMAQLYPLRGALRDLAQRRESALEDAYPVLEAVGRMMTGQLLRHARKEDEALFPALESIFGRSGTPTMVMRMEHQEIHRGVALYRAALTEIDKEHPAIVAGGERLGRLAGHGGSPGDLYDAGAEVVRLLDLHFHKEEMILFPMAREVLDRAALAEVAQAMETLAAGRD